MSILLSPRARSRSRPAQGVAGKEPVGRLDGHPLGRAGAAYTLALSTLAAWMCGKYLTPLPILNRNQ